MKNMLPFESMREPFPSSVEQRPAGGVSDYLLTEEGL
jgi:hypothetical protein